MSKINVYSSSASNAIKVFDANSTGLKPDNAILVTTGTEPSNAIQINIGEKKFSSIAVNFGGDSPVPPEPSLPPYTIRLKYSQGTTPTFSKGTGVLVDAEQNIWDLTYENEDWTRLLRNHSLLLEVLDANTSNVTNMSMCFYGCTSLTSVPLFDTSNVIIMGNMFQGCTILTTVPLFNTSNVTSMNNMFFNCTSLTTVPLFDTSKSKSMANMFTNCTSLTTVPLFNTSNVTSMVNMFNGCSSLTIVPLFDTSKVGNMDGMFLNCTNIQYGALVLYQQASSQTNPPSAHSGTFRNCGSNTETGAAELAQIPDDWK